MLYLGSLSKEEFDAFIRENTNARGNIEVEFTDGERLNVPVRRIVFFMHLWRFLNDCGIGVLSDFYSDKAHINIGTIASIGTRIIQEFIRRDVDIRLFKDGMWESMNMLSTFILENCQKYHIGLDVVTMCELARHPEVKKITDERVLPGQVDSLTGERILQDNYTKLSKLLSTLDHESNVVKNLINLRFINQTQLAHTLYQIGYRTDINDNIINYPIPTGYLEGMQHLEDMVFEALSAKKSIFYNKNSIPDTQFYNRTLHLMMTSLPRMHPGDCGSDVVLTTSYNTATMKDFLYKRIVHDGQLVLLTEENILEYANKTISLRSPIGCRHTDGCCIACGSEIMKVLAPTNHLGILSAIKISEKIVQTILSNKHFQSTSMLKFSIPKGLQDIFILRSRSIMVRKSATKLVKNLTLGFPIDDCAYILDLISMPTAKLSDLMEEQFGFISELAIKKSKGKHTVVKFAGKNKAPMFSKFLLDYIKSYGFSIDDGYLWVHMKEFDMTKPLFRITIENDSMTKFVKNFKNFFGTTIIGMYDASEVFNKLHHFVSGYISINVFFLEMMIKAHLVTSQDVNPLIPVVTDISNVRFGKMNTLVRKRSLGASLAYQELAKTLSDPYTFLTPRKLSIFDSLLNLKRIERPPEVLK